QKQNGIRFHFVTFGVEFRDVDNGNKVSLHFGPEEPVESLRHLTNCKYYWTYRQVCCLPKSLLLLPLLIWLV
ncbi:hypothetical protein ES288_A05G365400v1, partial [Gossypium darwinii]